MTNSEKVLQLRGIVIKALDQLIDRDYWLLEVPYYMVAAIRAVRQLQPRVYIVRFWRRVWNRTMFA